MLAAALALRLMKGHLADLVSSIFKKILRKRRLPNFPNLLPGHLCLSDDPCPFSHLNSTGQHVWGLEKPESSMMLIRKILLTTVVWGFS